MNKKSSSYSISLWKIKRSIYNTKEDDTDVQNVCHNLKSIYFRGNLNIKKPLNL